MAAAPLTPAEAFVLLDPQRSSPTEAFKIAFLSLIAQGALTIDVIERTTLFRTRRILLVTVGHPPPDQLLAPEIVQTVRSAVGATAGAAAGAEMRTIAKSAVKVFGTALLKLKTDHVVPALEGRGLVASAKHRIWGILPTIRYTLTPAGLLEKQRIEALLQQARRLPSLLQTSVGEAQAILLAAGGLLLLLPELKPIYAQLAALDRTTALDDGGAIYSDIDLTSFSHCDFSALDLGSFDMDFTTFDTSFDSSFSDGGDGGDGGGH